MRDAVIVATARTPIGRAYRGAFNNTSGAELGGHAIAQAIARAGIDPATVSAPLITTLVDATGLAIYLWIAKALLGL